MVTRLRFLRDFAPTKHFFGAFATGLAESFLQISIFHLIRVARARERFSGFASLKGPSIRSLTSAIPELVLCANPEVLQLDELAVASLRLYSRTPRMMIKAMLK